MTVANIERGEVELPNGMIAILDMNAYCLVEQKAGENPDVMIRRFANVETLRYSEIRLIIWASLQKHQPGMTVEAAGDICQQYPTHCLKVIQVALGLKTVEAEPEAEPEEMGNVPSPKAATPHRARNSKK